MYTSRLSQIPLASLASVLALGGAITIKSAQRLSSIICQPGYVLFCQIWSYIEVMCSSNDEIYIYKTSKKSIDFCMFLHEHWKIKFTKIWYLFPKFEPFLKMPAICKGKGIRFIVLYPPKCSHDLPPLAGTVHTETISIPRGILVFQSNWQHIAHTL